jgi:hypothetical protein
MRPTQASPAGDMWLTAHGADTEDDIASLKPCTPLPEPLMPPVTPHAPCLKGKAKAYKKNSVATKKQVLEISCSQDTKTHVSGVRGRLSLRRGGLWSEAVPPTGLQLQNPGGFRPFTTREDTHMGSLNQHLSQAGVTLRTSWGQRFHSQPR